MMSDSSIPVMNKPADVMSAGVNSNNLQTTARQRHPVDQLQRQQAYQKATFFGTTEEEEVRRIYGAGMAMQLATERRMALEMGGRGVAGLPSSNMMFEILSGNDMKLGFEDTLNLPDYRPIFSKSQEDPHAAMERKLGM
ncbi:unnamed protein product [Cylindrotheca closterium]|uniref:Proteasome maturation factor UMP1 n=1 Tax=Cylindrotheca closterium TaxID=2856 RepID=A0AAD2GE52_9STRA|nr:unnamed protein product [Cylindrotheca closterium]